MLDLKREVYELRPTDGRQSFYGKALVQVEENGEKILYSYLTKICSKDKNGKIKRCYDGWTQTTGRHIKAFCGLNKKEFEALPIEN